MITNALGWISTIVLARLLTPDDFGLVAIGASIQAILLAVTELSLSQALIQHRAPEDDHIHTAWTLGLIRATALAVILALASYPLSVLYGDVRLNWVINTTAFSVFLTGFSNARIVLMQRQLIFWQDFLLGISGRLVSVIVAIAIAVIYHSFWALLLGGIAAQIVNVLLSYMVIPYRPRFSLRHTRQLWSFSVWLTLGQAMNTINWRADQLLVGHSLGKAELGYYSVGDNLAQMPTREATAPLRQTLFPAFSQISDDPDRLRAAYQRAQGLLTAAALPVGVGIALVAHPVVQLAMSEKWLPVVPVIQALSTVFALQTMGTMVQPLGMALGATKTLFKRDVHLFIVRLPIIITAMLVWGLPGLIMARVFTGLYGMLISMTLVRQLTDLSLPQQFGVNKRSLIAILIMAVGVSLAHRFLLPPGGDSVLLLLVQIFSRAAIGAVLYLGGSWLLWRLEGRPRGPEQEVADLLAKFIQRMKKRQQAPEPQ